METLYYLFLLPITSRLHQSKHLSPATPPKQTIHFIFTLQKHAQKSLKEKKKQGAIPTAIRWTHQPKAYIIWNSVWKKKTKNAGSCIFPILTWLHTRMSPPSLPTIKINCNYPLILWIANVLKWLSHNVLHTLISTIWLNEWEINVKKTEDSFGNAWPAASTLWRATLV